MEARDTAKHPTGHGRVPAENDRAPNVSSAKDETLLPGSGCSRLVGQQDTRDILKVPLVPLTCSVGNHVERVGFQAPLPLSSMGLPCL